MPQSEIYSTFEHIMVPGERLISVVENVTISFRLVPHVMPTENYGPGFNGAIALTSHRVIALWMGRELDLKGADTQGWRWLHIPALNSVSERPLRSDRPKWPHQAVLMIPGGVGLVVQTQQPDAEHGRQLSYLLNQAIVGLGASRDDAGALAAILVHKEEEDRRRRE